MSAKENIEALQKLHARLHEAKTPEETRRVNSLIDIIRDTTISRKDFPALSYPDNRSPRTEVR